jgi:hypothetical protein
VIPHEARRPETVVTIRTTDGQAHEAAVNVAIPMRDLEAQWDKLTAKFLTLAVPVLGADRAENVVATCRALDELGSVAELAEQLSIH